jgi:hypothetical protein
MASHEIADKIALDQRERYILSPFPPFGDGIGDSVADARDDIISGASTWSS